MKWVRTADVVKVGEENWQDHLIFRNQHALRFESKGLTWYFTLDRSKDPVIYNSAGKQVLIAFMKDFISPHAVYNDMNMHVPWLKDARAAEFHWRTHAASLRRLEMGKEWLDILPLDRVEAKP